MSDLLAQHPWLYPALRHLHLACVSASIALFVARGLGVTAQQAWPMRPFWRRLSVAIDTPLNRPGFELTPRSWTVTMPPVRRCFSAGIALG